MDKDNSCLHPLSLLEIKSEVMLTQNISLQNGLVNGCFGVVEFVSFENVIVSFANIGIKSIGITRKFTLNSESMLVAGYIRQNISINDIPLHLIYAYYSNTTGIIALQLTDSISIHKLQGLYIFVD